MFRLRAILFLELIQLSIPCPRPAEAPPGYHLEIWETEQGMPQNSAKALAQTRDGYLWTGTFNGLARFNGIAFRRFTIANTPAFESDNINELREDSEGTLWIGTSAGLLKYRDRQFSKVEAVGRENVRSIAQMRDGSMAIGTDRSLWLLAASGARTLAVPDPMWPTYSNILARDRKGNVWLAHETNLFLVENSGLKQMAGLPGPAGSVSVLKDGSVWCGLHMSGLVRFVPETGQLSHWPAIPEVSGIAEMTDGRRLLASAREGLFWFTEGGVERFHADREPANPRLVSIATDSEGNVWVGSDGGGLCRISPQWITTYGVEAGLPHSDIISIAVDQVGQQWIGTYGGGMAAGREGNWKAFRPSDLIAKDAAVVTLCAATDGSIWGGIKAGPLFRIEGQSSVQRVQTRLRSPRSLFQARDGAIWCGSDNDGVEVFSRDGTSRHWSTTNGLSDNLISSIVEDAAGTIWLGTGHGVSAIKDGAPRIFGRDHGLGQAGIESLFVDSKGSLWAGTAGAGLARHAGGRFERLTTADGLHSDVINQMIEDDAGDLWIGCPTGLFRLKLSELNEALDERKTPVSCTVYGRKDGMRSPDCPGGYPSACWKAPDGALWFATDVGIVAFHPGTLGKGAKVSALHIEEVAIDGVPSRPPISGRMSVPPGTRRLEVRCVGLNLTHPEDVEYRYWLEGLERSWGEPAKSHLVNYNRLPPGSYRLRIKARLQDEPWDNATEASLQLAVAAYFWQIPWVQGLASLGALGLAGGSFWRRHTNRIRREEERLQQQEALAQERARLQSMRLEKEAADAANRAKSEFLASVSHEIRTPMNAIIGFGDLLRETELDARQREYIETLRSSSELLLAIINDILDYSKIEAGKLGWEKQPVSMRDLVQQVLHILSKTASQKGLFIRVQADPSIDAIVLADPGRLKQVLLNLVGNACKFTERGGITMTLSPDPARSGYLRCSVQDTGVGIAEENFGRIFEKFMQADASTTRKYGGTGLGLAISKRLVEMMGGFIGFESKLEVGSTFWFSMPLAKS